MGHNGLIPIGAYRKVPRCIGYITGDVE